MSGFYEKYVKKGKLDKVDCAREGGYKKSGDLTKKDKNVYLYPRTQSISSTFLIQIDSKHQFPACVRCPQYSWKSEDNLFRPWCQKINGAVFEIESCPDGRWKKGPIKIFE